MIDNHHTTKSHGSPDPEVIQKTYDLQAETYDATRLKTTYQHCLDLAERAVIRRHLPQANSALEVGAGTGRLTNELLARAESVTIVDISAKMLSKIQEKYPKAKNLRLIKGNVQDLQTIPQYGSFDAVLTMRMLPHIEDITKTLELLRAAVKPGGILIFDFWNPRSYAHWRKRGSSVYNNYVNYSQAVSMIHRVRLELVTIHGVGFQNPLNWNLEWMGNTPLKRFAHSLVTVCRRPC